MEELLVTFFQEHPGIATLVLGLSAAHALALFIVNLTPTPKDDAAIKDVYKFIESLAGIITKRSKED